jgi:hypothetical protein
MIEDTGEEPEWCGPMRFLVPRRIVPPVIKGRALAGNFKYLTRASPIICDVSGPK